VDDLKIRLAEKIMERMAEALLDGKIPPGSPLPSEGEIARRFGVSKPTAREAMRELAAIGLVSVQQGKLARAQGLNGGSLDRFYRFAVRGSSLRLRRANELRLAIETGFARLAAMRREEPGMSAMMEALASMQKNAGKPDAFADSDVAFHQAVAAATGNDMIKIQMEGLESVHREVSELFSKRREFRKKEWDATIGRHAAVARAIRDGNPDAAWRAMEAHFEIADEAAFEVAKQEVDWWSESPREG
jgi:GntR family transcriptional repressor for pyruvate dehydrogenase complex